MHHANVQCGAPLQTDLHIKKLEDGIFVVLFASFCKFKPTFLKVKLLQSVWSMSNKWATDSLWVILDQSPTRNNNMNTPCIQ